MSLIGVTLGSVSGAVGSVDDGRTNLALSEIWNGTTAVGIGSSIADRWDGTTWSAQIPPFDYLWSSVSCTWNGADWLNQVPPDPTRGHEATLTSVSCRSATNCTAVGFQGLGREGSVVENWNGTSWSVQADATPTGDQIQLAISCSSTTACTAVGG